MVMGRPFYHFGIPLLLRSCSRGIGAAGASEHGKLVRQRLARMSVVWAEAEIGKKLGTGAIDPKPTLVISVI